MTKEINQAENEIEALADVFGIATTGFDKFYKQASQQKKGANSKAASSGNYSAAASSGDCSTSASSGSYSTAASSGYNSTAASSGNCSTAASSGYKSKSVSLGDYSESASSGNCSAAVSSGYNSKSASSGDYSAAVSFGNYSKSASSGNCSTAVSSGNCSAAVSSGYNSKSASSGDYSVSAAVGYRAAVKGDKGNLLMASEYIVKNGKHIPVGGKADVIDGKSLKPDCWYIVEGGEWVEVDFTDGVFSRVISNKRGIKKVKTESGKILYVVSDENGNSAHGETLKEARKDLVYKAIHQMCKLPIWRKANMVARNLQAKYG